MEVKFIRKDGDFAEYEESDKKENTKGIVYKEEKIPERKEKKDV